MAIRSIPNCFAMVTAIASPRALNDPVGSRPSSLTSSCRAPRRSSAARTIGVSGSPRLTGSPPCGSSSRHFHMPGFARREAVARQRPLRRVEVVADEQRLAGAAEIVDLAGFVALAGQRAFEMGDVHQSAVLSWRMVAFDLHRAMLDVEAVVKHRPRAFEQAHRDRRPRRDDMRRQRGFGRAQRPDVKVVDRIDSVELGQRASTSSSVDPARHAAQRHPHRFLEQPDAAPQDHDRDREAHHRIDPLLPGPEDHEPATTTAAETAASAAMCR